MTESQVAVAIANLARLTQDGDLVWERQETPDLLRSGTDDTIEMIYVCSYRGKKLRIYERRFRDSWGKWQSTVDLEVCDEIGRSLDVFPLVGTTWDLWKAVRNQTSGVSSLIGELTGSMIPN